MVKNSKKIDEGAQDEKECTVSTRCRKCQVHLCLGRTINVFGIFTSKENINLPYVKPAFIYSLANIFIVPEIRCGWGYVLRLGLG